MPTTPQKPPSRPRKGLSTRAVPKDALTDQVSGISSPDSGLVASGYRNLVNKQQLSTAEQAAVRRYEKQREERLRWQHYASIPQKHWRQMSGRQTKVLNEQAQRYGLPFGGPTINLPAVIRALHDFLADNALKLARDEDELMRGANSPALERYREERVLLVRLDRLQKENQLQPRDEMKVLLGRIASVLRAAGDTLQQQFGTDAREILDEALDDAEAEVRRALAPTTSTSSTISTTPTSADASMAEEDPALDEPE